MPARGRTRSSGSLDVLVRESRCAQSSQELPTFATNFRSSPGHTGSAAAPHHPSVHHSRLRDQARVEHAQHAQHTTVPYRLPKCFGPTGCPRTIAWRMSSCTHHVTQENSRICLDDSTDLLQAELLAGTEQLTKVDSCDAFRRSKLEYATAMLAGVAI